MVLKTYTRTVSEPALHQEDSYSAGPDVGKEDPTPPPGLAEEQTGAAAMMGNVEAFHTAGTTSAVGASYTTVGYSSQVDTPRRLLTHVVAAGLTAARKPNKPVCLSADE